MCQSDWYGLMVYYILRSKYIYLYVYASSNGVALFSHHIHGFCYLFVRHVSVFSSYDYRIYTLVKCNVILARMTHILKPRYFLDDYREVIITGKCVAIVFDNVTIK